MLGNGYTDAELRRFVCCHGGNAEWVLLVCQRHIALPQASSHLLFLLRRFCSLATDSAGNGIGAAACMLGEMRYVADWSITNRGKQPGLTTYRRTLMYCDLNIHILMLTRFGVYGVAGKYLLTRMSIVHACGASTLAMVQRSGSV